MGQYHYIANIDKREFLHPHTMGDGLKLMEFGASGGGTMLGLALLLACSNGRGGGDFQIWDDPYNDGRKVEGIIPRDHELATAVVGRWAGDRIAVIGDYRTDDDFPGFKENSSDDPWANEESDEYLRDPNKTNPWLDISLSVRRLIECSYYAGQELGQRWDTPDEADDPYAILA
jgi:hypothetical protein